jgi:hypothetical protein
MRGFEIGGGVWELYVWNDAKIHLCVLGNGRNVIDSIMIRDVEQGSEIRDLGVELCLPLTVSF